MSEQELEEVASRVYAVRGYLVVGFEDPMAIGYVARKAVFADGTPIKQPLRVMAETDYADCCEQARIANGRKVNVPRENFYYRVESD